MGLKIALLFTFCFNFCSLSFAQNEHKLESIQQQILPERLETIFKKLKANCTRDVEVPMRNCLQYYDERTNHAFLLQDSNQMKKISCCGISHYDNCVLSLVRSRARESYDSCDELDLMATEDVLQQENENLNHLCHEYNHNLSICGNEPIELWLLILLWAVGGVAIIISLGGALCMLYLFVTTGHRPRVLILHKGSEARKTLVDHMEA